MTHALRRSAPYVLLSQADTTCVWGRLQLNDSASVKLATVWGAAGRTGDQVTAWTSDPVDASRLAATGQASGRRRGLRRFFSETVEVSRRDLTDADIVLATLMALHPRGTDDWPSTALPQQIQVTLARTAIMHRRADGTSWRVRDQHDADAVAALLCAMADAYRAEPGPGMEQLLAEMAEHLPEKSADCHEAFARLSQQVPALAAA